MKNILEGALDLHVHSAPDVLPRKMHDLELAQRFIAAGMEGFCLKSHYFCTSERASLVNIANPGFRAMGAVVLNSAVGGLNPAVVEMAALSGAKIVWLPTCDSRYEQNHVFGAAADKSAKLPFWAKIVISLKEQGITNPTISLLDENGNLCERMSEILPIIKRHDIVLATGHISHEETFVLAKEVARQGIKKFVVTHVTFPSTFYTIEEQKRLVDCGAYLEHCATTHMLNKVEFAVVVEQIKAIGPERVFLSTDLGQPANPYPDEGMFDFVTRLHKAGFSKSDIRMMVVDNPRSLVNA